MDIFNVLTWTVFIVVIISVNNSPLPDNHHVHHRIHVPQKIKTIHHTKIIKVPQHHHYFHKKEKIIVEAPHHKEDLKATFKDEKFFDHDDGLDDFSDFDSGSHYSRGYGGEGHNIFKKHAVVPKTHKRSRTTQRKKKEADNNDK